MHLCIEILGESPFHKFLLQSGWSGRDYHFHFNRHTNSHMRAYRSVEAYLAERVDLHKSANIWPLLFNWLPEDKIEAHVFTEPKPKPTCAAINTASSNAATTSAPKPAQAEHRR